MKPAPRGLTVLALALLVSVAAGGRAHGEASPADALARAEVLVRNGSYEEGVAALRHDRLRWTTPPRAKRAGELERVNGFEPSTSTLARCIAAAG